MSSCSADSRGEPRRRTTGRHLAAVAVLWVLTVASARPASATAEDAWALALQAGDALERGDGARAEQLAAEVATRAPGGAAEHYVDGLLALYAGRYDEAAADLAVASEATNHAAVVEDVRRIAAQTADVVRGFATYRTRDGLFEIRYDESRDAVLIPWAEETLEAAYYEIGYDLGSWPEPPIRVEIYPRATTLAQVSPLSEDAIRGSGTIALCKYHKLMFTSPRATLQGYDWRTTLAHEYVHYAIAEIVHTDVPIWLHEGFAKYLEGRWTGSREPLLDPSRDALLTERAAQGRLITFAQMHPSMAYLPTPEDASTAYAEVFTVMEYLVQRRGPSVVRALVRALQTTDDATDAIVAVIGEPFDVFEASWLRALRERPPVEIPGRVDLEVQLVPDDAGDPGVDHLAGVDSVEARDRLRLGELLRARGQHAGAIIEYQRAAASLGDANPPLQAALARSLLDAGRPAEALEAAAPILRWYPGFAAGWMRSGAAHLALGDAAAAEHDLLQAGGINPFDPELHTLLASAYQALGRPDLVARHRRFAELTSR
ncbi:MAG: hypothetical protein H6697_04490 [Myxococcales bacterium]|nr:hypothetical protein [Myxococcales bacterium]MCB9520222.1 hypothetical protein [Myxococcales bacterium]